MSPPPEPKLALPIEWLPQSGAPEQLILLLHGWAADAASMSALAQALRVEFPQAAVLAPDAPHAADGGRTGRQWYSTEGLAPDNWARRVAGALPALHDWVLAQQRRLGVGPAATALGGFSQGAILALELAALHDGLAGRVLAFGGGFSMLPLQAPRHTTLHLFHGGADSVIPAQASRDALEHLGAMQGDATLDIAEGIGHVLHPALVQRALFRLRNHIPARTWAAALGSVPGLPPHPED